MKKIVASIMALLTVCGAQTSAWNGAGTTAKKVIYNVCTKVIPAVAVTVGVGVLAKKIFFDKKNNSDPMIFKPELPNKNSGKNSNRNSDKNSDKNSYNSYNAEKEAYEDGVRYIRWHSAMCWFNASILYLYYHDYYRDYLYNLKEDTYKEDDKFCKKVTIELSRLIKKIKDSPACMCELTKEDYNRVLSLYNNPDFTFGKCGGEMSLIFTEAIKYYDLERASLDEHLINDARSASVVYRPGHFYTLYHGKKTNRLYTIGRLVDSRFENSVEVLSPGSPEYDVKLETLKNNKVIYNI